MTNNARRQLAPVLEIIEDLRPYWPLTLRQIYYQAVASLMIENRLSEYKKLSRLLTDARMLDLAPWEAMEDRSRLLMKSGGWSDEKCFIDNEAETFLRGYRRDLLQSQKIRPEVWIEKDALSRVCHNAAFPYCVPVIVARGFSSTSFLNDARNRIVANADAGQGTRILFFGDLDPSGVAMLPAVVNRLGEMGVADLFDAERHALTLGHVREFNLPINPNALKEKDSRAKKYREQFGDVAVELDALRPEALAEMVGDAISDCLDMSLFRLEVESEKEELEEIEARRAHVLKVLEGE